MDSSALFKSNFKQMNTTRAPKGKVEILDDKEIAAEFVRLTKIKFSSKENDEFYLPQKIKQAREAALNFYSAANTDKKLGLTDKEFETAKTKINSLFTKSDLGDELLVTGYNLRSIMANDKSRLKKNGTAYVALNDYLTIDDLRDFYSTTSPSQRKDNQDRKDKYTEAAKFILDVSAVRTKADVMNDLQQDMRDLYQQNTNAQ
ncbi:MAG: hypothetical protein V4691_02695 [Pseudomonadota bacterium]